MKKKKIVNITVGEFNTILKNYKNTRNIIYNKIPKSYDYNYNIYIIDKISKIEMTLKDGLNVVTYVTDKAESSLVHEKTGMEAYSTLKKYVKIPHISDKRNALFSFAGILYSNPKYNKTRQYAYGYDLNSAFNYAMLKPMPKNTDKGPININKKLNCLDYRKVKKGEIGFDEDYDVNGNLVWKIRLEGEFAYLIYETEESPFKKFVDIWYKKKKEATSVKEKIAAKDMLVMSIGYLQRHNFILRGAIIGYSNRLIEDIINKYKDNVLLSNTDSIVSNCKIPEIENNIGDDIGQWKLEHEGDFAYIDSNYQWNYDIPTFRGIPKKWFNKKYDILNHELPENNNVWEYSLTKKCLIRRKNEKLQ